MELPGRTFHPLTKKNRNLGGGGCGNGAGGGDSRGCGDKRWWFGKRKVKKGRVKLEMFDEFGAILRSFETIFNLAFQRKISRLVLMIQTI